MSDNSAPSAPKFHQGDQAILLFLNRSWRAMVTTYHGWRTDNQGRSDHYYRVLFRDTTSSKERRLHVPERYLLPMEQQEGAHHAG